MPISISVSAAECLNILLPTIEQTCQGLYGMLRLPPTTITLPKYMPPRLLFPPMLTTITTRISEQEARFMFVNSFEICVSARPKWFYSPEWFYSVETPTTSLFMFAGTRAMRANSDLSLWKCGPSTTPDMVEISKISDIEFKGGNKGGEKNKGISNDIEKLVREPRIQVGVLFYLLENIDIGTFPSLLSKIRDGFIKAEQKHNVFDDNLNLRVTAREEIKRIFVFSFS